MGTRVVLKLKPGHVFDGKEGVVIGQTADLNVLENERKEKAMEARGITKFNQID